MESLLDFTGLGDMVAEFFTGLLIWVSWVFAYGFAMLGIIVALFIVMFGKIQMWLALAFAPIGVLAYLVDKGRMLNNMIALFFTGIGTYLVAGALSNVTANAYADQVLKLARQGQLTGTANMSAVMVAMFAILYAIFFILVMRNAVLWAHGLFGGAGFDPTSRTLNTAFGRGMARGTQAAYERGKASVSGGVSGAREGYKQAGWRGAVAGAMTGGRTAYAQAAGKLDRDGQPMSYWRTGQSAASRAMQMKSMAAAK